MPSQTQWVEPERFLEHRGVIVLHTYKDDDVDQGTKRFHFTVNPECSPWEARCDRQECRHVFDVRDLSAWIQPDHPPYCTGTNDTPQNRACLCRARRQADWDRFWQIEQQSIRLAIVAAIESGELTGEGHRPLLRTTT